MKKVVYLKLTICSIFLFGCQNEKKTVHTIKKTEPIHKSSLSVNNNGVIVSKPDNIILNYNYCDLITNKEFVPVKIEKIENKNIDSLSFVFKIRKDTLKFSYQFSNKNKEKQDRNVIFNNKKNLLKKVVVKDSTLFNFNGFMCDYKNASFLENKDYLLIKSRPNEWTGSINQFRFYQLIDKKNNLCYEFFLNENANNCK